MKKKKIAAFAAVVTAFVLTSAVISGQKKSLVSQTMADRWSADGSEFSQLSVFFPHGEATGSRSISFISDEIKKIVSEGAFVSSDSDPDNLWTEAYSSEIVPVVAVTELNNSESSIGMPDTKLSAIGIDGDFFEFHPLELLNGNYIYRDEIRSDRVVLDENAAWNLFSSTDVVGMNVWISGVSFEVAGVVKRESGKTVETAYPVDPIVYMHFSKLDSMFSDEYNQISLACYEAVMPNPVENYARNTLLTAYGIDTMTASDEELEKNIKSLNVEILENTSRYSITSLADNLKNIGSSAVVSKPVAYPYWENSARVMMAKITLMFGIACILAATGIIMLILFFAKLYLRRTWHLKDYIEKLTYKYTYKKKISDYINLDEKQDEN